MAAALAGPADARAASFAVGDAGDQAAGLPVDDAVCTTDADPAPPNTCTLRAAVQEANGTAGADTVTFNLASPATITLGGTQLPQIVGAGGPLTVTGPGAAALTVSGNQASRVFEVASGATATISGLTITKGRASGTDAGFSGTGGDAAGGGINNAGTLTLTGVVMSENAAAGGAGGPGDPNAVDFAGLTGGAGGNSAGGGVLNTGTLAISASTLVGNTASGGTGGGSVAGNGPAPKSGNGGHGLGGAVASTGTLTIENSTLTGNSANGGYGAQGGSTGIGTQGGEGGNAGSGLGGGVYSAGQTTITGSTVSANTSYGGTVGGGGDGNGPLSGQDGVPGQPANGIGAGVQHIAAQMLTVTNTTISGNSANTESFYPGVGFGGGIATSGTSPLTATHVTLVDNAARSGGANLGTVDGPVTLRATIIAGLAAGPLEQNCVFGASVITSSGFNLDDGTTCKLPPTDRNTTEPSLGPLADNGGPTRTHLPLAGSPVLDAVTSGCPPPATDQRGTARPGGAACDIGAVEVAPTPSPTPTPTPSASPSPTASPTPTPTPTATATPAPSVRRTLSLKYVRQPGRFRGRLGPKSSPQCSTGVQVTVKRRRKGPDPTFARAKTTPGGAYKVKRKPRRGVYYATVAARTIPGVATCSAARSKPRRVR